VVWPRAYITVHKFITYLSVLFLVVLKACAVVRTTQGCNMTTSQCEDVAPFSRGILTTVRQNEYNLGQYCSIPRDVPHVQLVSYVCSIFVVRSLHFVMRFSVLLSGRSHMVDAELGIAVRGCYFCHAFLNIVSRVH
jgi:hypothetical protein